MTESKRGEEFEAAPPRADTPTSDVTQRQWECWCTVTACVYAVAFLL